MPQEKVILYPDLHDSEIAAENYQRIFELDRPEAVYIETGFEDLNCREFQVIQEYYMMEDIYNDLGIEPGENLPTEETPLYALEAEELNQLWFSFMESIDPRKNHRKEIKDAMYSLRIHSSILSSESDSTLIPRVILSGSKINTSIETLESSRDWIYEKGAREKEELPENPEIVKRIFYNTIDLEEHADINLKTFQAINELLEEVEDERIEDMTSNIQDSIRENDYERVSVFAGSSHISKLYGALSDIYNVTIKDFTGQPGEWQIANSFESFDPLLLTRKAMTSDLPQNYAFETSD